MNKPIEELKTDLENAERDLRFANLRRQWLERCAIEAPTEQEFDSLLVELSAQEETIKKLGSAVLSARSVWATADNAARYGAP